MIFVLPPLTGILFDVLKCKYFIMDNTGGAVAPGAFRLVKLLPSLNARYEVETLRRVVSATALPVRQHCGDLFNKFLPAR